MNNENEELMQRGFEQQTQQLLNQHADSLPAAVTAQLNISRGRALSSKKSHRQRWVLATAFSSALLAVLLLNQPMNEQMIDMSLVSLELAADPQLLEELEFIYWLSELEQESTQSPERS